MCFSGKQPKVPDAQPLPTPSPTPTIMPSTVSAQAANDVRRKQLEKLQYGLASTIKTGPRGIVGTGAELVPQQAGKQKLG